MLLERNYPSRALNWDSLNQANNIRQIRQLQVVGSLPKTVAQNPNATVTPTAVLSGVPKVVSLARAFKAAGTVTGQKNVTVSFLGNPEDANFSHCKIWLTNYKGSAQPILMSSVSKAPATFAADATGETVVVTFQSVGSKGEVPLSACPTTTITLS